MALSMEQILEYLQCDEPDYGRASKLGPDALPFLENLVEGDDAMLAAKAASLAGMIGTDKAVDVLGKAANSADPTVRVAAAAAARGLDDEPASRVLSKLVGDSDFGVQKTALKSLPKKPTAELSQQLSDLHAHATPELASLLNDTGEQTFGEDMEMPSGNMAGESQGDMPAGDMNDDGADATEMPAGNM